MPSKMPAKADVKALLRAWKKAGSPPYREYALATGGKEQTIRRWISEYAPAFGLAVTVRPNGQEGAATTVEEKPLALRMTEALAAARGDHGIAARALGLQPKSFLTELAKTDVAGAFFKLKKVKRYVVLSAQNATPAHKTGFKTVLNYCRHHRAQLAVIPLRYKNPTSLWSQESAAHDWWDECLVPYLCDVRLEINANLVIMADIKAQPTASDPLSGFESMSRGASAIFGHPKVALKSVPVPSQSTPKLILTTGSITVPNYSPTAAGKKGEFHHSLAGVVIEVYGDRFHVRHLCITQDGSFIDLDKHYSGNVIRDAPPAAGVVLGDMHAQFSDPDVLRATFEGPRSLVGRLKPKHVVWHDTLDFYSANHHHKYRPFTNVAKTVSGLNLVAKELKLTFNLVKRLMALYPQVKNIFVASNHDEALTRWIESTDWREDPANAEVYLETALHMVRGTKMDEVGACVPNPFEFWGRKHLGASDRFVFLHRNAPMTIAGVGVGNHGDVGANGARGSLKSFARWGQKQSVGHSHSCGICEGAHQVGTSSRMGLEYVRGASSWMHTHDIIYANGKRTLCHIIGGQFTTEK